MITMKLLGKRGKAPTIWYDVAGYITNIAELAKIFEMHHVTLRARLKYDWDIVPACLLCSTAQMSFKEVAALSNDSTLEKRFLTKLGKHFARPTPASFGTK